MLASQLSNDYVGYALWTAKVGTGPLSPGHGDRGLIANLMSFYRVAAFLVLNCHRQKSPHRAPTHSHLLWG